MSKNQLMIPNTNTSSNHFNDKIENSKNIKELRYDSDTVLSSNIVDSNIKIAHKKTYPGNQKGISFERRLSKSGAGAGTKLKKKIEAKVVSGVVFDAAPMNGAIDALGLDSSSKSSCENLATPVEEKNIESSINKIAEVHNLNERKRSVTLEDKI
ncbi:hypothetical protein AYI70_g10924, partial [Smittium culicis]